MVHCLGDFPVAIAEGTCPRHSAHHVQQGGSVLIRDMKTVARHQNGRPVSLHVLARHKRKHQVLRANFDILRRILLDRVIHGYLASVLI